MAMPRNTIDKAWKSVVFVPGGCWLWVGYKNNQGYGRFKMANKWHPAHRLFYEDAFGPVPAGLVIDHLCREVACVNPLHLEPVTQRENTLRGIGFSAINAKKTHCECGDALVPVNGPYRGCVKCKRARKKVSDAAKYARMTDAQRIEANRRALRWYWNNHSEARRKQNEYAAGRRAAKRAEKS